MEFIEIFPIAMLATAAAIITWFSLYTFTDIEFFQSFYSVLIFPLLFGALFIFIYKKFKK